MSHVLVPVYFFPASNWSCLRELCGHDEQSVEGTGTLEAIRLLDRLMVSVSGTDIGPGKAKKLTTADRDRLLAAIYMRTYGSRVESTIHCNNCNAPFDIDFSLEELVNNLNSETDAIKAEKSQDGVFKLPDGRSVRLPTGEDEFAVWGMSYEEAENTLLERCVVDGDPTRKPEKVQCAMKDLAPIMDLEIEARCPECDQTQLVHFNIQYFLLYTLMAEQKQLALEVHRLAVSYAWSQNEILELPRSIRRNYVALVESELDSNRRI